MRKSSALLTTLVAASAITIAWRVGDIRYHEAPSALLLPSPSATEIVNNPSPSPEAPLGPSASASPSSGGSKPSPSAKPTSSSKPKPAAPVEKTVESDPINYKYGTVQVSITKLGKKITSVDIIQGDATNGRAQAYDILTQATVQVQGTNYGNVSGATFTTEAFKKAVDNALAKF